LLLQPQVLWEPVFAGGFEMSSLVNGARTLIGAHSVNLVPVLPGAVAEEWIRAVHNRHLNAGAMFSLPFGLRAFARFDADEFAMVAGLNEFDFGPTMKSARQLRIVANSFDGTMTGSLQIQRSHSGPTHVLDIPVVRDHIKELENFLPLRYVDLSGYGLSTFSDWRRDAPIGVTEVRFDVINGRTSLEVIQVRTILAPCEAHLVQTIIMERRNPGRCCFDSGLVAVDDGLFENPQFDKGVVAFRKIRRIQC
jgi:hypothetical protein